MGCGSPSTGIPLVRNAGFSISEMFGIGILMNSVLARRGLCAIGFWSLVTAYFGSAAPVKRLNVVATAAMNSDSDFSERFGHLWITV